MPMVNIHGEPSRQAINIATSGDNTLVNAIPDGEIFIEQVVGAPTAPVILTIKCGARVMGIFNLQAGQGLTIDDIVGQAGEPRFKCYQGEAFIINLSAAVSFTGAMVFAYKK